MPTANICFVKAYFEVVLRYYWNNGGLVSHVDTYNVDVDVSYIQRDLNILKILQFLTFTVYVQQQLGSILAQPGEIKFYPENMRHKKHRQFKSERISKTFNKTENILNV